MPNGIEPQLLWRHLQSIFEHVVEFTQGSLVAAAVAVVWSTEDGHDILVMTPVETLHKITAFHTESSSDHRTIQAQSHFYVQYRVALPRLSLEKYQ